ncbi:putative MarR family transcriptional regulator [Gordonia araii NBRC 100433]|uniref:Putative MarR family transcriptional regulator n=1 Tax=Gordonia araii NBRC 100433 TaxID=1073574 RepID=G7GYV4_9ACTN|nr:MarR family transcriptional regulator [Gordonia araii]NNG96989.1 MarR family transcriptional regulator [Gordonia araii NBRC 100433]GAB08779.1 putative MarR family transcriptional regulator [Gordonia araii NBRC 100433]
MNSSDPRWQAWQPFIETSARIQTRLDEDLRRRHGLSLSDYQVLLLLSHAPRRRLRMSEIADAMVFSSSRLSYQIDKLARGGLVCREQDETDRRGNFACLTDAGLAALTAAADDHLALVERLFIGRLSMADGQALVAILDKLGDGRGGTR